MFLTSPLYAIVPLWHIGIGLLRSVWGHALVLAPHRSKQRLQTFWVPLPVTDPNYWRRTTTTNHSPTLTKKPIYRIKQRKK